MFRLLPGEEGDHTVYVIDFYDRCKYFGYTREPVFYRAASLAAHVASWGTNIFVEEHAAQVPYAIRCIKSGLNDLQARRLRDTLVAQAPRTSSPSRVASSRRPIAAYPATPNWTQRHRPRGPDHHERQQQLRLAVLPTFPGHYAQ